MNTCPTCGGALAHLPGLTFDAGNNIIIFAGTAKHLGPKQAIIFGALYRRLGHAYHVDYLITLVYDLDEPNNPRNCIAIFILKLRRKLEGSGYYILNQWGGYFALCFDPGLVTEAREAA